MSRTVFWHGAALAGFALLSGCASLSGPSAAERSQAADEVLATYDVPDMLRQVAPIIRDSLANNLPESVPEQERQRLAAVVAETYDADALTASVAQHLRANAETQESKSLLIDAAQALQTPLAESMIAREQAATTEEFAEGFRSFRQQPLAESEEPRLETARTLVERMRLVSLQVVFNAGMLEGMVAARNAVASPQAQTSPEDTDRMVQKTEGQLRERMTEQLPGMLFYAYRGASDEDLARYAELQASPPLAWANRAIPEALEATLADAAKQLPETYRGAAPAGS